MKKLAFFLVLLPFFTLAMNWWDEPKEARTKARQEKTPAQNLQEIAKQVKQEADAAKKATQELIDTLRSIPTHLGYRTDTLEGQTSIQHAKQAEAISTEKIKALLKLGANPNKTFSISKRWYKFGFQTSPLTYALSQDFLPIALALINAGANINFSSETDSAHNALMQTISTNPDIAQLLLEMGANPNVPITLPRGNWEHSPLYTAVREKKYPLIQSLIAHGANPLWNRDNAYLPAVWNNDVQALEILLTHKNSFGKSLSNALNEAVGLGKHAIVKLLLLHEADPNMFDENGNTILSNAVMKGNSEIVRTLLQAGANPLLKQEESDVPKKLGRNNVGFYDYVAEYTPKSALMVAQEKFDQAQTDQEKAIYLEIIEMLNNPQNIRKTGFEKIP